MSGFLSHTNSLRSPGDYGSMVNELVGTGEWENSQSLGETWRGRNVFSYGRNEGGIGSSGTARPEVLDKLLATTDRVVQEIDSVEYGLSDIQGKTAIFVHASFVSAQIFAHRSALLLSPEYYANTGGTYRRLKRCGVVGYRV